MQGSHMLVVVTPERTYRVPLEGFPPSATLQDILFLGLDAQGVPFKEIAALVRSIDAQRPELEGHEP
jgi:hypothetical protein